MSEYRGEVRPRRQPVRHHIEVNAASHDTRPVDDPFPPLSNRQFPAFYQRSMIKNVYRNYMKVKTPYTKRQRA